MEVSASRATRRYDATGRRARAARNAAHIVETAGRLFSERGYEGTTIATIADEAGVSAATIYGQFGNKPTLLSEWLESVTADAAAPTAPHQSWFVELQDASGFEEGLHAFVSGVSTILQRTHAPYAIARSAGRSDAAVKALYREKSARRHQRLKAVAGLLAELAPAPPRDDVDTLADFLWASVSPSLYDGLVVERGWTHERFEEHLRRIVRTVYGVAHSPDAAAQPS